MEYKTNVMRMLDKAKIDYNSYTYSQDEALSGTEVANVLNQDEKQVFKTLVTIGKTKKNYVFVIPVAEELDLKKAAAAVGEKSIEMIKSKDLLTATGYVHGGCSPIGMKKAFKTTVHLTAENFDTIIFSAGKIGYQVEVKPSDLMKMIKFELKDIVK